MTTESKSPASSPKPNAKGGSSKKLVRYRYEERPEEQSPARGKIVRDPQVE